jgi:hypothetical protein
MIRYFAFVTTYLLITLAFSAQAHATPYLPLVGSQWSSSNPGVLPYSQCVIGPLPNFHGSLPFFGLMNQSPEQATGCTFGLCAGRTQFEVTNSDLPFLTCVSEKLKLAYAIPLGKIVIQTVPSFTVILSFQDLALDIKSRTLSGKTLKDLYGKYSGFKAEFAVLIAGVHYGRFRGGNEINMKMKGASIATLASFALGHSQFEVKKRQKELSGDELANPYILTEVPGPVSQFPYSFAWVDSQTGTLYLETKDRGNVVIAGKSTRSQLRHRHHAEEEFHPSTGLIGIQTPDSSVVKGFYRKIYPLIQDHSGVSSLHYPCQKSVVLRTLDPIVGISQLEDSRFIRDEDIATTSR